MGKLRPGSNVQIHASGNAMTVHGLQNVRVHCSTHGRKVKALIAVAQRDLVLRIQGSVVPNLNGLFAATNEGDVRGGSSKGSEAAIEMYDAVARRKCDRRFRTQVFDNIR